MLYLLRHGESEGNVDNTAYERKGHNIDLTDKGKIQASSAGTYLRKTVWRLSHVYSSPLLRATQTTKFVLRSMHGFFDVDEVHIANHIYEQASNPSSPHEYSVNWKRYVQDVHYAYGDPGFEESFHSMVHDRCVPFANMLREQYLRAAAHLRTDEPEVLVVSHDLFLRGLRLAMTNSVTPEAMLDAVQHSSKIQNGQVIPMPFILSTT